MLVDSRRSTQKIIRRTLKNLFELTYISYSLLFHLFPTENNRNKSSHGHPVCTIMFIIIIPIIILMIITQFGI